jgi:phage-related protein
MKPLAWIGSAKEDLLAFPAAVVREMGHVLFVAQMGAKHVAAKPLRGFGGAAVLEVVEDHRGNTYRAIYTVRFAEIVYVLHAFQKKSKSGITTPRQDMEKVRERLKRAEEDSEWRRRRR